MATHLLFIWVGCGRRMQRTEACALFSERAVMLWRWRRKCILLRVMGEGIEEVGEGSALHPWKTCVDAVLNWSELLKCGSCASLEQTHWANGTLINQQLFMSHWFSQFFGPPGVPGEGTWPPSPWSLEGLHEPKWPCLLTEAYSWSFSVLLILYQVPCSHTCEETMF